MASKYLQVNSEQIILECHGDNFWNCWNALLLQVQNSMPVIQHFTTDTWTIKCY